MRWLKKFAKDFEDFAVHGNALDLAIGVVIGASFNQVTTSLSTNILTPFIGLALGGLDFSKLAFSLGGDSSVTYGVFLQNVLNFILIALSLFMLVKLVSYITRRRKEADKKPSENPELKVLNEIRDLLKKQKAS